MRIWTLLLATAALTLTAGCAKEAARIPFTAEGPGQTTANLQAGDVAFWTDIDVSFDGDSTLVYKIELQQNNATVATATCNPFGQIPVKTGWVETNVGQTHSRRGSGKMACDAKLPAAGATTVKATVWWSHKPTTLTFKKADLVIKQ